MQVISPKELTGTNSAKEGKKYNGKQQVEK